MRCNSATPWQIQVNHLLPLLKVGPSRYQCEDASYQAWVHPYGFQQQ
jgi:hypothetical protein